MSGLNKIKNKFQPFYSGFPVIIIFALTALFFTNNYLKYATPVYESVAEIKLADSHEGIPNSNLYKDFDVFASTNKIGAEVELLQSNVLLNEALSTLNLNIEITRLGQIHNTELYYESPFRVKANITDQKGYDQKISVKISNNSVLNISTPWNENIQSSFNKPVKFKYGTFLFQKNDSLFLKKPGINLNDNYCFQCLSPDKVIAKVKSGLDVMSIDKDVPVLRISYRCGVPKEAADVVNAIAGTYINDYVKEKILAADTTVNFLNNQLSTYSNQLSSSENAIENYRNEKTIVNIPQETETDLRKIAELKKQLASVQMNLRAVDSLNSYIQQGQNNFLELAPNFEAFNDLLSTEIVKKIKNLQADKEDLLLKYTPQNEKVLEVDQKISDLTSYIRESIENTRTNLRIKYNDLTSTIAESQKVFIGLPAKERTMTTLDRDFAMNDQIYRFLHEKKTDAEIAKAANISFHRIISNGEIPEAPVSPNSKFLKVLAVVCGLLFGFITVYFFPKIKGRIENEKTIYKNSDTPLFMAIPKMKNEKEIASFFKKIAVQLELKNLTTQKNIISISSYNDGEGKDFIASRLSHALSKLNKSIMLIIAGNDKENIISNINENILIHKFNGNRTKLQELLKENENKFDFIIIKNASLEDDPQGMLLMSAASLNLFLLDSIKTKKAKIEEADIMKEQMNIPNMHYILNRSEYYPSGLKKIKDFMQSFFSKKISIAN